MNNTFIILFTLSLFGLFVQTLARTHPQDKWTRYEERGRRLVDFGPHSDNCVLNPYKAFDKYSSLLYLAKQPYLKWWHRLLGQDTITTKQAIEIGSDNKQDVTWSMLPIVDVARPFGKDPDRKTWNTFLHMPYWDTLPSTQPGWELDWYNRTDRFAIGAKYPRPDPKYGQVRDFLCPEKSRSWEFDANTPVRTSDLTYKSFPYMEMMTDGISVIGGVSKMDLEKDNCIWIATKHYGDHGSNWWMLINEWTQQVLQYDHSLPGKAVQADDQVVLRFKLNDMDAQYNMYPDPRYWWLIDCRENHFELLTPAKKRDWDFFDLLFGSISNLNKTAEHVNILPATEKGIQKMISEKSANETLNESYSLFIDKIIDRVFPTAEDKKNASAITSYKKELWNKILA